jgi:hypothetical protein
LPREMSSPSRRMKMEEKKAERKNEKVEEISEQE